MAVYTAIIKAKAVLSEAKHLGILENKDDPMGEEVKLKRPKKNPKEEKLGNPVAKDDINSGYGHVGDKHYIGKSQEENIIKAIENVLKEFGDIDDMHEEDKALSDELEQLSQDLPQQHGAMREKTVERMHEIIQLMMEGFGAPGDTSPGQPPASEDTDEGEWGSDDEWKALLHRK